MAEAPTGHALCAVLPAFCRPDFPRLPVAGSRRADAQEHGCEAAHQDASASAGTRDHLRPQRRKTRRQRIRRFRLCGPVEDLTAGDGRSQTGGGSQRRRGGDIQEADRVQALLLDCAEDQRGSGGARGASRHRRRLPRQGAEASLSQRRDGRPRPRVRRHRRRGTGGPRTPV